MYPCVHSVPRGIHLLYIYSKMPKHQWTCEADCKRAADHDMGEGAFLPRTSMVEAMACHVQMTEGRNWVAGWHPTETVCCRWGGGLQPLQAYITECGHRKGGAPRIKREAGCWCRW